MLDVEDPALLSVNRILPEPTEPGVPCDGLARGVEDAIVENIALIL